MKNKKSLIITIIGIIVMIAIISGLIIAYNKNDKNSSNQTSTDTKNITKEYDDIDYGETKTLSETKITERGSYEISGTTDPITVDTEEDVELVLNDVTITSSNAPAINIVSAKTVSIVLKGENTITSTTTEDLDGAIYSKADLIFSGDGTLTIKSNYDGIVSKDTLIIKSGTYNIEVDDDGIRGKDNVIITDGTFNINAGGDGIKSSNDTDTEKGYITIEGGTFNIKASSDGIQAITKLVINGGDFTITSSEGLEATYIVINDGTVKIEASDDGINASNKSTVSTPTIEINGGNITINMGQGDTDALDVNGNIYINGGTINITAQSPFDYDNEGKLNGGTVTVNGSKVTELTNQMMGGGMVPGGDIQQGDPTGRQRRMR